MLSYPMIVPRPVSQQTEPAAHFSLNTAVQPRDAVIYVYRSPTYIIIYHKQAVPTPDLGLNAAVQIRDAVMYDDRPRPIRSARPGL